MNSTSNRSLSGSKKAPDISGELLRSNTFPKERKIIFLYLFASLIIGVSGLGHLIIQLFNRQLLGPPDPEVYAIMNRHQLHVFGFTRSVATLMDGFSYTMAVFMIGVSLINSALAVLSGQIILYKPLFSLVNALLCLTVFILSVRYFHWPPILSFVIAFIAYTIVFIFSLKRN